MISYPSPLNLYITDHYFYLEPRKTINQDHVRDRNEPILRIHRQREEGTDSPAISVLNGQIETIFGGRRLTAKPVEALFGIAESVDQPQSRYLVLVTRKIPIGELGKKMIWRIETCEIIDFQHISKKDDEHDDLCKRRLIQVLSTPYFYFSYDLDLTHTQQRVKELSDSWGERSLSLYERADKRFIWNQSLLKKMESLIESTPDVTRFMIPIIHGAVFVKSVKINQHFFTWSILSRRSRYRVGTRFFVRGSDDAGNVANFVETEQIVEYKSRISSFVQTRGSIPAFWQQTPDLRYKPEPRLCSNREKEYPARLHFSEQLKIYGQQICINLVDHKKAEGMMEETFRSIVDILRDPLIRYKAFDFHAECKPAKGGWSQLHHLIADLREIQKNQGYFLSESQRQTGVFRTNCMDCLDRTNVVQSLLALEQLKDVFLHFEILLPKQDIMLQFAFQDVFKNTWADHANLISIQYSGTGALKTDFTRTGVRTKWGLLQDGWNSSIRYIKNNFMDGFRQDAVDYFVGNFNDTEEYRRAKEISTRICEANGNILPLLPKILLLSLFIFALSVIFLSPLYSSNRSFLIIFSGIIFLLLMIIRDKGYVFVNFPMGYNVLSTPPIQHGVKKKLV